MQSKKLSFIETCANTFIGFLVALASQPIVYPLFGIHLSVGGNLGLAAAFTAISFLRSYIIRRFFNTAVHNWVDRTFGS